VRLVCRWDNLNSRKSGVYETAGLIDWRTDRWPRFHGTNEWLTSPLGGDCRAPCRVQCEFDYPGYKLCPLSAARAVRSCFLTFLLVSGTWPGEQWVVYALWTAGILITNGCQLRSTQWVDFTIVITRWHGSHVKSQKSMENPEIRSPRGRHPITPEPVDTKIGRGDYVPNIYRDSKFHYDPVREFCPHICEVASCSRG